jgi:hypothetical protein
VKYNVDFVADLTLEECIHRIQSGVHVPVVTFAPYRQGTRLETAIGADYHFVVKLVFPIYVVKKYEGYLRSLGSTKTQVYAYIPALPTRFWLILPSIVICLSLLPAILVRDLTCMVAAIFFLVLAYVQKSYNEAHQRKVFKAFQETFE